MHEADRLHLDVNRVGYSTDNRSGGHLVRLAAGL